MKNSNSCKRSWLRLIRISELSMKKQQINCDRRIIIDIQWSLILKMRSKMGFDSRRKLRSMRIEFSSSWRSFHPKKLSWEDRSFWYEILRLRSKQCRLRLRMLRFRICRRLRCWRGIWLRSRILERNGWRSILMSKSNRLMQIPIF